MNEITKPTILVVDDDPSVVNSVLSILKSDYTVRPFTSAKNLFEYLNRFSADLIVMDFYMPEMTGGEALIKIRENPAACHIPVIFLTGSAESEAELLEKGANDYLLKPVKPIVLLARIRLQLELQAYRNHLEQLVEAKTEEIRFSNKKLRLREELAMNLLARATDMRDHDTGSHIQRTTEFSRLLVESLMRTPRPGYELTEKNMRDIVSSVKLHDIGKIAVPDNILRKPGKLEPEEFEFIKKHASYGADLLKEFIDPTEENSFLTTAYDIALYHHEKWDGQGYPTGLSNDKIPLSARIAAIADVYDALTSVRAYKKPFDHEKSKSMIIDLAGTHFDPYLIEHFMRVEQQFEATSKKLA